MSERVLSVAMCQPATRMICVVVWAESGEDDSTFAVTYPVLAIRDTAICAREGDPDEPIDHWMDAIVLDDGAIMPAKELAELYDSYSHTKHLFVCDWPTGEDEERIADWVRDAKRRCLEHKAYQAKRKASRPIPKPSP